MNETYICHIKFKLKIGDELNVLDIYKKKSSISGNVGKWRKAIITEITSNNISLVNNYSIYTDPSQFGIKSTHLLSGKQVYFVADRIKVHFLGWESKWDIWLDLTNKHTRLRIAKPETFKVLMQDYTIYPPYWMNEVFEPPSKGLLKKANYYDFKGIRRLEKCCWCGKENALYCSSVNKKISYYCNKNCQKQDWKYKKNNASWRKHN